MPASAASGSTTQVHRLFFAIRPDAAAATAAAELTRTVCAHRGLASRPLDAERLHVTLHWLQDHAGLPAEVVAAARRAGAVAGGEAAFAVAFDTLESFGDARRGGPLVVSGGAGLEALRRFQRCLAAAMVDAGIGNCVRDGFRPHMTLRYDKAHVAPEPVAPIRWTVDELMLVDSLVGRHRHVVLGQWPLQGRHAGPEGG
jgi:2'-5' RNA ligase